VTALVPNDKAKSTSPSGYPVEQYLLVDFPEKWVPGEKCLTVFGQFDTLGEAQRRQREAGGFVLPVTAWLTVEVTGTNDLDG
jgi:hypothetical protein